ncbi:unnamed protein product [Arabidopsis halleri]
MALDSATSAGPLGAGLPSAETPTMSARPPAVSRLIPKSEPGVPVSKKSKPKNSDHVPRKKHYTCASSSKTKSKPPVQPLRRLSRRNTNRSASVDYNDVEDITDAADLQDGDDVEEIPQPLFLTRYQENRQTIFLHDRKYPELKFPSDSPYSDTFLTEEGLGRYKFSLTIINQMFQLPNTPYSVDQPLLHVPESLDEIAIPLSNGKALTWKQLSTRMFDDNVSLLKMICCHNWMPTVNRSVLKPDRVTLLFMVSNRRSFNFGKLIYDEI